MTFDVIPDESHEEGHGHLTAFQSYGIVAVLLLIIAFTYRWILKTEARQRKERVSQKTTAT